MPDPSTALAAANPYVAGAQAALGLGQTVASLIKGAKAKKIGKELEKSRPQREISPLYGQSLSLAESELAGGMSTGSETAYNNALDRQQSGALSAILRGGGDVNSVGDVFASGEEGRQRLAMLTDQLRLKQIDNVLKTRDSMAEEQDKNFIFNKWMPWSDKAQANSEARKSAEEGVWSGLSTFVGGASNLAGGMGGGSKAGAGETMPDGNAMWQEYSKQQQMDNASQGNYTLPGKFNTEKPRNYFVPDELMMSQHQLGGLYNFLNGGQ